MNLTPLIKKLQKQLRLSESLSEKHQQEARAIRAKLADISRILGGLGVRSASPKAGRRGPRKMSARARSAIARAQKRRWAAWRAKRRGKAVRGKTVRKVAGKRKLSAAGRARIIAAQKKRWAAFKAKKSAQSS